MSSSTEARPDPPTAAHGASRSSAHSRDVELSLQVLTAALALSVWVACGSLILAVTDATTVHPTRRLLIGVLLVFGSAGALWRRQKVCTWLRARPWLIIAFAAAQFAAATADGLLEGPYVSLSITSIGLAVIVARPRTVWLCVALLALSYAAVICVDRSPAQLARSGQLAGALGALLAYPFAALIGLGVVRMFARFLSDVDRSLHAMRHGATLLTPALSQAVLRGGRGRLALAPARAAPMRLTPAEIRVVEGLAAGRAPKELAHQWGLSVATVRTHIAHAKRKTGARTLRELATMVVHLDWPDLGAHEA